MPATAGRVRMPHNNRVAAGKALQTSAIWSQTIGHNPYAERTSTEEDTLAAEVKRKREAQAKGLLELAREQRIANASASGADAAPSHGGGTTNSGVGRFAENNLTTQVGGNDYAQKMYYGLKQPKKRKLLSNDPAVQGGLEGGRGALDSSSSEDEYIVDDSNNNEEDEQDFQSTNNKKEAEEEEGRKEDRNTKKKKKERKKRKRKHRDRKKDDSSSGEDDSDSDDDSSSSSSEEERRRRKKHNKKKRRKRRDDERDRHSSRKCKHKRRKHRRREDNSSSSSDSES